MGPVDAGLAPWLRQHRYLQPVDVDQGESSMALLLLWEVEHARPFPTAAEDPAKVLMVFTRRLMQRVAADEELRLWLTAKELQRPLAPGLPDSHHTRWSLQICPPQAGEPRGWYDGSARCWRVYLGSLAQPTGHTTAPPVLRRWPPARPIPLSRVRRLPVAEVGAGPGPWRLGRSRQHAAEHYPNSAAPSSRRLGPCGTLSNLLHRRRGIPSNLRHGPRRSPHS